MRRFVVEVYEDNDINEQAIHIELLSRFGNMIASVKEEAAKQNAHADAFERRIMLTPELVSLISKIDLSTPDKISAFKTWQFDDGTLEGLQKLHEAQQSAQADVCPECKSGDRLHEDDCSIAAEMLIKSFHA